MDNFAVCVDYTASHLPKIPRHKNYQLTQPVDSSTRFANDNSKNGHRGGKSYSHVLPSVSE
jgi:hypothetical protein